MTEAFVTGCGRVVYDDVGPRNDGPTLLLVHGFPLSRAMWRAQLEGLAATCRVVAPDLRGFGGSTLGGWPGGGGASLDRYADDLVALLDRLEPRGPVALVGFSMGGYVALALERWLPGVCDALVLMDTRAVADTDEGRATRLKMADHVAEWGASRVAELMRPRLFAPQTPESVVAETARVIAATNPAAIAAAQRAMATRPDSTPLLPLVAKPTLVVVGEHDAISPPEEMRAIAEAVSGARFAVIADAGHMAPVEDPDAVNDLLRGFARSL